MKEARKQMNNEVHNVLGLQPSHGGSGWEVNLMQLIKYILHYTELHDLKLPDNTIKRRVTYDGAEVAGKPGIIGYIVPMNLGLPVQSALSAFPLFFFQCAEKGKWFYYHLF